MARSWRELAHLARRFWLSARAAPPSPADEAWALAWLSGEVADLWRAQPSMDRRHSVAVARALAASAAIAASGVVSGTGAPDAGATAPDAGATDAGLTAPGGPPPAWALVAALTHDVGKADAALGTAGRAVATVWELLRLPRPPGRLGRYRDYPETGARWLAAAGAPPEAVAWAREHHGPPGSWTVPRRWGELLARADRDARARPTDRCRARRHPTWARRHVGAPAGSRPPPGGRCL